MAAENCRGCHKLIRPGRPMGLCRDCLRPELRRRRLEAALWRGTNFVDATPPPPGSPTCARAGSEEKILVMIARAEAGEQVFHPGDNPMLRPLAAANPWRRLKHELTFEAAVYRHPRAARGRRRE